MAAAPADAPSAPPELQMMGSFSLSPNKRYLVLNLTNSYVRVSIAEIFTRALEKDPRGVGRYTITSSGGSSQSFYIMYIDAKNLEAALETLD